MAALPQFVGKYRVEDVLGRGAMGVVLRAHDPDIDRTVAIKLVRTDLLEGDDRAHYIARFRNEAKMVGRCVHPNIVGIHDFALHEGSPFLVLEYVDGKDLGRTFPRGKPLDLKIAVSVTLKVLEALSYAHSFGIIHRDIKPANILCTASSAIKVTDFGISRALASSITLSSVLVGTPCYMSPEQCLGGMIDARSDLFSLGCVLYEMLSGEQAFAGPNYVATTHRILNEQPRPLGDLRPDLPAPILRAVDRALAKRAEDRFGSAADMAHWLQPALGAEGNLAHEDGATVILRSSDASLASPQATFQADKLPAASLATLERRLAHHLGPIARIHLRRAMMTARTPDELGESLAGLLPPSAERDKLRGELLKIMQAGGGQPAISMDGGAAPPTRTQQSSTELDTIGRALTQVIGPIGPRLLRHALKTATTPEELEAACLKLIDSTLGREEFRRLIGRLPRK